MADHTAIEWTDATWNPIVGCSVVSPGCTNCYAMQLAGTRLRDHPSRAGLTKPSKAGPVWTGEVRLNRQWLPQPIEWKRPRRIFVCAHGDLFAEGVPDEWILDVFTVMAAADQHSFQVLTKRSARMREFVSRRDLLEDIYANWHTFSGGAREVQSWPLHNVWLGVSAERQQEADERIPDLLATPAAIRFVSYEPALGPVDFTNIDHERDRGWEEPLDALRPYTLAQAQADWGEDCTQLRDRPALDWIICGGESGPKAHPMHPDWARAVRDQCAAAGTAFFFKQWGEFVPDGQLRADGSRVITPMIEGEIAQWQRVGKKRAGRLLDGVAHNGFPLSPAEKGRAEGRPLGSAA